MTMTMTNPALGLARAVENVRYLGMHGFLSDAETGRALRRICKQAERLGLQAYEPEQFRIAFRQLEVSKAKPGLKLVTPAE